MPETIMSKIAGVSHKNEDGRSRQTIIRKCLEEGDLLDMRREPNNPHSSTAIALFCSPYNDPWDEYEYKVGYINGDLSAELAPRIDAGEKFECTVEDLTGGEDEKTRGVNIRITKYTREELQAQQQRHNEFMARVNNNLGNFERSTIPEEPLKTIESSKPEQSFIPNEPVIEESLPIFQKAIKIFWNWYWFGIMQHGSSKARIFTIIITFWLIYQLFSLPFKLFSSSSMAPTVTPTVNIQTAVAIESARIATEISMKATQAVP